MTFKDLVLRHLHTNGMSAIDAQVVAEIFTSSDSPMAGRWNDAIEDYPKVMHAAVLLGLDRTALAWIDANKPQAWYRPMFLPADEREKLFADQPVSGGLIGLDPDAPEEERVWEPDDWAGNEPRV